MLLLTTNRLKLKIPLKAILAIQKRKKSTYALKEYVKIYILNEITPYYEKITI